MVKGGAAMELGKFEKDSIERSLNEVRRIVREHVAGRLVNQALGDLWLVLQQKRGCRR